MPLINALGALALDQTVQDVVDNLSGGITVKPENVSTELRESFESFDSTTVWELVTGAGDIVQLDGNALGASYLVISKDPLSTGTETTLTTRNAFLGPLEVSVGMSISQRTVGQECSLELVSTDAPLAPIADIAIASIVQSITTLTITTVANHGLSVGTRIGLYGVTDSRFNYSSLVVASIVSATQITCTAGPAGTIASVTAGPYTDQGHIYHRPALGYAQGGMSEIFENAVPTNASLYMRTSAGDVLPSGTFAGNQSVTVASVSSTLLTSSPYTYAVNATTEYKMQLQADKACLLDTAVDSTSQSTVRLLRNSVVPSAAKPYKLRFRISNNKGLSVPTAIIVSAVKSGSSTATVTTASPHGLTTSDNIVIYGNRDQTNFANLSTATAVASIINATRFTIAYGISATATTYGGMVMRVQGNQIPTNALTAIAAQSVSVVASGYGNSVVIVGNTNWAWAIGDYVNVYGLRNSTTGADLGLDGVYVIANQATTALTLLPIGSTPVPGLLATTNCGGTVLRRCDVRISYARIFKYLRERVEIPARNDLASSVPIVFNQTLGVSGSVTPINSNSYALLTSTNLGASATFTGSATNAAASGTSATVYNTAVSVAVQHTAGLAPGTLVYEVGSETSSTAPTTWYPVFTVPVPSNASWQTFTFPITARYYRIRFINGSTAQTSFRLATTLVYNGALGAALTYPNYLLLPLSVTPLAASAVFTGATLDFGDANRLYKTLTATAFADQASGTAGFAIQVSRDGSTWRTAASATVAGSALATVTSDLVYRYARVLYTNGATLQGVFNLDCQAGV